MMKRLRRHRFILLLLAVLLLGEFVLRALDPVGTSTLFSKNDYEKIVLSQGSTSVDRAFYGNSVVISAYIQEDSESGYANWGIDYGTITDLMEMLRRGLLEIEEELVLGLNYFNFYDDLDTNETYPWHRRFYEPYVYFQRDRLHTFLTKGVDNLLRGEPFAVRDEYLGRSVYYGAMEAEELAERVDAQRAAYWSLPIEDFAQNLAALEELAAYCGEQGIRLRVLWMPWNPEVEIPQIVYEVMDRADEILQRYGVESLDGLHSVPAEYFHDIGHLDYETGAPWFTRWIDAWLMQ